MNQARDRSHPGDDARALQAAAGLYHAYFTGLILTLVTRRSARDAAEWVLRVFRHQHHEKFLSSFGKLGLEDMPDAVACAAYHYLSNSIGGVSGRVHARERPQGVDQFRAAALDLSRRQHLRCAERGLARLPARLVRPEWCFARKIPGSASSAPRRPPTANMGSPAISLSTTVTSRRRSGCSSAPASCRPLRSGEGTQAARRRLAARAAGEGRTQLRDGIHPLRPAAAGRDFRAGRGGHLGRVTGKLIGAQLYKETAALLGVDAGGAEAFGKFMMRLAAGEGDEALVAEQGDAVLVRRAGWRMMRGLGAAFARHLRGLERAAGGRAGRA